MASLSCHDAGDAASGTRTEVRASANRDGLRQPEITFWSVWDGETLRVLRKRAGTTIELAARAIGLSKQVVSRLETGQRNISPDEVAGLLALYGVTGPKRDQLLTMARTLNDPGWWELGMPGLTQESATLADYEDRASRIISWAPLLVSGLLQTMDYARSFMLDDGVAPSDVESRLTAPATPTPPDQE